jgi:hypothetical protein
MYLGGTRLILLLLSSGNSPADVSIDSYRPTRLTVHSGQCSDDLNLHEEGFG